MTKHTKIFAHENFPIYGMWQVGLDKQVLEQAVDSEIRQISNNIKLQLWNYIVLTTTSDTWVHKIIGIKIWQLVVQEIYKETQWCYSPVLKNETTWTKT